MKIVKFFLGLGLGLICMASLQVQGMNNEMTDQDFDQLFTFGNGLGLANSTIARELNRRCVHGAISRGQQRLYPLEHALYTWPRRAKAGNQHYQEESVVRWITTLLASGASCKYSDFNPLTCLLFLYDRGDMSQTLFERLATVLHTYGADPNDTTADKHVVTIVGKDLHMRKLHPLSPLEAHIDAQKAVSALDILNNVEAFVVLTPDAIASVKAILRKPLHEPEPIATEANAAPYRPYGQPEERKPRIFNMSHMFAAVAISFVCGIGAKCLYDWYYTPDLEDEPIARQDMPAAL